MKAEEALQLSEKNQDNLKQTLEAIKVTAERGGTFLILFQPKKEVPNELMELGYKISKHKDDLNGQYVHVCSWD
jgi:hypothetical protein